jgi:ubiquinone/menaquinone biosynthesis C-methylase UbiE
MPDVVAVRLAFQEERAVELAAHVVRLLAPFSGDERALDSGCGTGALATALAPHVASVVGVDADEKLVAAGRERAPANCELIVGDATGLPFGYGTFDLSGCLRVLHHVRRPELVVAELARVTAPGGRILLVDQLGHTNPVDSAELDRYEHARDPSHHRLLPDQDIRALLEANDLVVVSNEIVAEHRDIDIYLDLVGLEGDTREHLRRTVPSGVLDVEVGWYVARKGSLPGGH